MDLADWPLIALARPVLPIVYIHGTLRYDFEFPLEKAEAILKQMNDRHRKYSDALVANTSTPGYEKAQPNTLCYNLTLHALARSHESDVTVRAESIVKDMEEISSKDPNSMVQCETVTYNSLMNIYANQRGQYGIGQRAEDILLGMAEKNKDGQEIVPDTRSFNTVLKAWLHSGECAFESAVRAEQLLRLMAKLQISGHDYVRPDAISFATCLQAFANSDNELHGTDIVEHV